MNNNLIHLNKCSNEILQPNDNIVFDRKTRVLGKDIFYNSNNGIITILKEGSYYINWRLYFETCNFCNDLEISIVTSDKKIPGECRNFNSEFFGYYIMTIDTAPLSFSLKNTSSISRLIFNNNVPVKGSLVIFDVTDMKGKASTPGEAGDIGDTGPQGPAGAMGPIGPIGPTGPTGDTIGTGPTGPTGPTGAIGFQGPPGNIGPRGARGVTGPIGPNGPTGPIGIKGQTGEYGLPGENGYSPSSYISLTLSTTIVNDNEIIKFDDEKYSKSITYSSDNGEITISKPGIYIYDFSASAEILLADTKPRIIFMLTIDGTDETIDTVLYPRFCAVGEIVPIYSTGIFEIKDPYPGVFEILNDTAEELKYINGTLVITRVNNPSA